jgi:hypothetical protein
VTRWLPWALCGLLAVLCVWRPWAPGPVTDVGRDAHIDSSGTVQRMDSNALASTDSALARAARDSSVQRLNDSAVALGHRLDSLDRVAMRLRRANQARKDSLRALAQVDSMTGNAFDLDTVSTAIAADTGDVSCESRYAGRLTQLTLMGEALDRCRIRGDTLRAVLIGVRDTLLFTRGYLQSSDSLLRWERDRPRPCQVDLWVKKVSCEAAMGGTAVVTSLLWLVATH